MPTIRILPDRVANQIAAGEVIERPVAVVKELVENSLDAGATRIEIEFRNGGKSYIHVDDNGYGMNPDDALLALERHATSKIREANDLSKISTFGFRGEALPSVASVSRFTLRTRSKRWEHGSEILVNGGKLVHRKECGMPEGTSIEVAHLFNAVPARRKFLKTENTEAAHIVHLSRLYAVANPKTSFTLMENGRNLFRSPICPSLRERVSEIFGQQMARNLIEIEAEEGEFKLSGLIGKPGVGRSTRQEMVTYVNRRPVDSRTLNFALIEAYHTYIPKGRYPLAFLFLELNPHGIDVNVHPTKREVRFRDEGRVRHFLICTVLDRLREASSPFLEVSPTAAPPPANTNTAFISSAMSPPRPQASQPQADIAKPVSKASANSYPNVKASVVENLSPGSTQPSTRPVDSFRLPWHYLGLAHEAYAIFESEAGLIILNRQGAHERILFEEIRANLETSQPASQKLLFPFSLELDALSSSTLTEHFGFFKDHGFEIELFGRNFFRIEALPNWLDPAQGEGFVRDLVGLIRERGLNPRHPFLVHEEIARLAAIRAASVTTTTETKSLAQRLMACQDPLTDPRGRPTFFEISRADLKKRFGK